MKQAEKILTVLTSAIDRQSDILNKPDVKAVKILMRIVDGVLQEPEISIDLKKTFPYSKQL